MNDEVVIVSARRTPMGNLLGELSPVSAPELAAVVHRAVIADANLSPGDIDEVLTGCVLQAGIGQAPARQAAIKAGIPTHVGATTINKMCGSGMKTVMMGHDLIKMGGAGIVLAGGMESMSNAPYLLSKARQGYRLGHGELKDHLFIDGLEDAYEGKLMGYYAEATAARFGFSREQQDAFAISSMTRAINARENGCFTAEIAPVTIKGRKGETLVIKNDEGPDIAKLAKVSQLKPAFKPDGTVTAANSSSISDGAASLLLMSRREAERRGLTPLASIVAQASFAQDPAWFTTAPVEAIRRVLKAAHWQPKDVELYEINEAFAVVAMAAIEELALDMAAVNVHGGACALGHPIGASGARILVTLIHALKQHEKKRGVAALCIGGGEATAIAIEVC